VSLSIVISASSSDPRARAVEHLMLPPASLEGAEGEKRGGVGGRRGVPASITCARLMVPKSKS
jgi:hypothetical protein